MVPPGGREGNQAYPRGLTLKLPPLDGFASKYEIFFFDLFLLSFGSVLHDSEVEINDVLDAHNSITFIVGIYKAGNYMEGTIPLYFPDELKSHFRMTKRAFHSHVHTQISCSSHVFSRYLLKLKILKLMYLSAIWFSVSFLLYV